jgi:hypothetical protein
VLLGWLRLGESKSPYFALPLHFFETPVDIMAQILNSSGHATVLCRKALVNKFPYGEAK